MVKMYGERMSLAAKTLIGTLVLAVIVLGAVLIGQGGQKNKRAEQVQAVERSLPDQINERLEGSESKASAQSATCIRESDVRLRCVIVGLGEEGQRTEEAVRVTLDPDRAAYLWEADA